MIARLAASLLLAASGLAAASVSLAAPGAGGAWGAAAGAEPCGSELLLEQRYAADPGLRERLEALARAAERGLLPEAWKRPGPTLSAAPTYVIPVAVHVVHQNGPENLSVNQVLSQIAALNRDCRNLLLSGSPAVDTGIEFCLATQVPAASSVTWDSIPGITWTTSPETNHTYGSLASETALKAIDYLPADRYLNIWVVKTIAGGGGGIAGYATFPGAGPLHLDGIVMRHDCFGSNTTGYGTFNLIPSNPDGKILAHEVGHYLNLLHTFHGGCTPPGDQVADTPAEAVNRVNCPLGGVTSCSATPDPIENFMDYTNDACRWAFTAGQRSRMHAAIGAHRGLLVSASNLAATGCPSGLNALIVAQPSQVCAGGTVQFTTPASGTGYVYAWSFPGGSPASAATQSATVTYASPGIHTATLHVSDPSNNFSTNTAQIYVIACAPILSACTNWVFPNAGLSFASGLPAALSGTQNNFGECGAAMSSPSGSLLFYTNSLTVWDASHNPMPNGTGLLGGQSSHHGALAVPRPGSSTQYFVFTISESENGWVSHPARYSVVDRTLNAGNGDVVAGQKNLPIPLPPLVPKRILEGQQLVPHCNGVDWWLIHHSAELSAGTLWVTLVTASGPVSTTSYAIGINNGAAPGAIASSRDGSRLAVISWYPPQLAVYAFDRSTGVPTTLMAPTGTGNPYIDACFSPDGKLVYFTTFDGTTYGYRQLQISTGQQRVLATGIRGDVELGPDGRVYLGDANAPAIHVVNFPDQFNTANANECGLNLGAIPLAPGVDGLFGALPNTLQRCVTGPEPAQFTFSVTGCTTVSFQAANCAGPYSWNFGDATTGSGKTVTHTYAGPGTYVVTLTVPGASPSTQSQTLTLQAQPVSIAGPSPSCTHPSNYSAVGPLGYVYSWTVTGGSPASAGGSSVDVTWGPSGGTITLTATDPATGCTAQAVKPVGWCPTCVRPPLGMSAWWPLDEPAGSTALEIVAGNDGQDVAAPLHAPGKVLRGRQFDGATGYVRVADESRLDVGTGDFTIDAWIRTSSPEDPQPIVDKRSVAPERGYALYLRSGRLALRAADGTSATEALATAPNLADGQWHHVAAVVRRTGAGAGTYLFADGAVVASFPPLAAAADLSNAERLLIGGLAPESPAPALIWNGDIDEVELFRRALTATEVLGIAQADTLGKCKQYVTVPRSVAVCRDSFALATVTVCNSTTATQSYSLSFAGLPAGYPGVGTGCSSTGPSTFVPLSPMPVVVPAHGCVTVPVRIYRPPSLIVGSACYQVTATNLASGVAVAAHGGIWRSKMCGLVVGPPVVDLGVGTPATLRFRLASDEPAPVAVPYELRAWPAAADEPAAVSLGGLPPGEPVLGVLALGPGDSADVVVEVAMSEPMAFRFFDVELGTDSDGDGVADGHVSAGLRYVEQVDPRIDAPPASRRARLALLPVAPHPIRGRARVDFELPRAGRARLALYDVGGRRVRTLLDEHRPAGRGAARLDAAGLGAGVYFLRLEVAGGDRSRRVVVIP